MFGEPGVVGIGEQSDGFGWFRRGIRLQAVEGIESDQARHALRMVQGPVDPGRPRGVVHDEHHAIKPEAVDDRVQIALLVGEGVVVVRRLVRFSPAEKIERHDMTSSQVGDKPVVQMVVVRESVHQHDRWSVARLLPQMDAVTVSTDEPIVEPWLLSR